MPVKDVMDIIDHHPSREISLTVRLQEECPHFISYIQSAVKHGMALLLGIASHDY